MVPVHVPATILGRYFFFSSGEACTISAAMAPCVRPGYMAKAMLAEQKNSLTIEVSVAGRPWPPNSSGAEMPIQPPSTNCLKASLKPAGVLTLPSGWRSQPSLSPTRLSGVSTSSLNLAASRSTASTVSGEASAKPGRLP